LHQENSKVKRSY